MWKQCLKCAVSLYGNECTAQDIKYNSNFVDGGYQCQNAPGTCRKAICECDLAFAQHMGREAKEWDIKYWAMDMGGFQHFNTTQCVQPIGGNYKARFLSWISPELRLSQRNKVKKLHFLVNF